jgi:hypothetical protein
MRPCPEEFADQQRFDSLFPPPGAFIAAGMELHVVVVAEGCAEPITCLQTAGFSFPVACRQVVGIYRPTLAVRHRAPLRADKGHVRRITYPGHLEHWLYDLAHSLRTAGGSCPKDASAMALAIF